ncbi:hypothetical protein GAN98_13275 [Bacteroides thetaiotaomicron]|uniref:Uncharacterized protein n=1 Tax=Bacteroides thetaiotaomicron TaxID=818 RepID=A0A6I0S8T3_BACT4|nr:hypothetical protein GAN98_13275 [Bacteroides thetaiotaomicron]KAB4463690.1 hypothetical protein GAN67_12755 [Bacteroides thetaiotaomicron]KAB4473539.1 hypothetical protein GAN76_12355 [Bacteroides thetaiotaomicron]KAB4473666.1 hypothetical protein GAN59_12505 [Bacteroides thetaiotaomicron]KAB4484569.1 hypothetical protein GAN57_13695 [Bacteroides thetaiotaomicron]
MITLEHLRIYKKYHGDGDILIRCATLKEKELMDYESWSIIDDLVQDLIFVEKGSVSDSYIKSTNDKLRECCDSENAIRKLKKYCITFEE